MRVSNAFSNSCFAGDVRDQRSFACTGGMIVQVHMYVGCKYDVVDKVCMFW